MNVAHLCVKHKTIYVSALSVTVFVPHHFNKNRLEAVTCLCSVIFVDIPYSSNSMLVGKPGFPSDYDDDDNDNDGGGDDIIIDAQVDVYMSIRHCYNNQSGPSSSFTRMSGRCVCLLDRSMTAYHCVYSSQ